MSPNRQLATFTAIAVGDKIASGTAMTGTARTVLIVDDDELIRSSFQYALSRRGFTVLLAEHGTAALDCLERHSIDIVFLDIYMPQTEGIETLVEIKRRFPSIPVYVMSGGWTRSKVDVLEYAQKLGATGILHKPVTAADLVKFMDALPDGARPAPDVGSHNPA